MTGCCAHGPEAIPAVTPAMAARSGIPLETLQRGNALYIAECGRCHELEPPARVKTSDWRLVLPGMCWNAGLSRANETLILKYILATRDP